MKKPILILVLMSTFQYTQTDPIDFAGYANKFIGAYSSLSWKVRAGAIALPAVYGLYNFWSAKERNRYAGWMEQGEQTSEKKFKAMVAHGDAQIYKHNGYVYGVLPLICLLTLEWFSGDAGMFYWLRTVGERLAQPAEDSNMTVERARAIYEANPSTLNKRRLRLAVANEKWRQ